MRLWQRFSQWYKRLRHSKGFGIHSPYAFMLVNEVINNRYRYYGYDDIEGYMSAEHHSRRLRHDARLLIRIFGRFRFENFVGDDGVHDVLRKSVAVADSRVNHCCLSEIGDKPTLVFATSDCYDIELLKQCVSRSGNWIIFRGLKRQSVRSVYNTMVAACHNGVVLEDTDIAIIIANDRLPHVKYTIMI